MSVLLLFTALFAGNADSWNYSGVFYCTYQNGNCIEFQKPVKLDTKGISELVALVVEEKENFVGFTDSNGTTLQFIVEDIDVIWVEIPFPEQNGSYGTQIDIEDMQEIIGSLKQPYLAYKAQLGMEFQPW